MSATYGFTDWHRRRAASITSGFVYQVEALETLDELRHMAWDDWEEREGTRREDDVVVVHFLRHARTAYEWQLRRIQERQGGVQSPRATELAYEVVRTGNVEAIAAKFPELAGACEVAKSSKYLYGSNRRRR